MMILNYWQEFAVPFLSIQHGDSLDEPNDPLPSFYDDVTHNCFMAFLTYDQVNEPCSYGEAMALSHAES